MLVYFLRTQSTVINAVTTTGLRALGLGRLWAGGESADSRKGRGWRVVGAGFCRVARSIFGQRDCQMVKSNNHTTVTAAASFL